VVVREGLTSNTGGRTIDESLNRLRIHRLVRVSCLLPYLPSCSDKKGHLRGCDQQFR
jgi:hypothetical protein